MRVAILVKEFPPDVIGGTETQSKRLASALQEHGDHDASVITKSYPTPDEVETDYDLVRIPSWHLTPFVSTLTFVLGTFLYLLTNRRRYDILQCMMIYPNGFVGYLVHLLSGLPYFAWIRGGDYYFMKENRVKRWMIRTVLEDTLVLVQTERVREDVLAEFPKATLSVLGNGVDVPEETANGSAVVFVGRLEEQKGVDVLLEAMADSQEHLLVVGDGSKRERLEAKADRLDVNAEFVGEVAPESVPEYLRQGKVFVLPSVRGEGLPNALLEAMAIGLPVVVTDTGGVADAVREGETGFVVEPGDTETLKDRIKHLSEDETERRRMGEAARSYVQSTHCWPEIVDRLDDIYTDVCEE